jgi:hypothetical protein
LSGCEIPQFGGFFLRRVFGFSSLTDRLGVLLDRLLPLDLDQGNRASLDLDQTFEVVNENRHQRLKLVLDLTRKGLKEKMVRYGISAGQDK